MNAVIFNMADFRRIFDPANEACEQVRRHCAHRVTATILAQAMARAGRMVAQGIHPNVAASRATSWALCSIHPEPTENV